MKKAGSSVMYNYECIIYEKTIVWDPIMTSVS